MSGDPSLAKLLKSEAPASRSWPARCSSPRRPLSSWRNAGAASSGPCRRSTRGRPRLLDEQIASIESETRRLRHSICDQSRRPQEQCAARGGSRDRRRAQGSHRRACARHEPDNRPGDSRLTEASFSTMSPATGMRENAPNWESMASIAVSAGAGGHTGSLSPFALVAENSRMVGGAIACSPARSRPAEPSSPPRRSARTSPISARRSSLARRRTRRAGFKQMVVEVRFPGHRRHQRFHRRQRLVPLALDPGQRARSGDAGEAQEVRASTSPAAGTPRPGATSGAQARGSAP